MLTPSALISTDTDDGQAGRLEELDIVKHTEMNSRVFILSKMENFGSGKNMLPTKKNKHRIILLVFIIKYDATHWLERRGVAGCGAPSAAQQRGDGW